MKILTSTFFVIVFFLQSQSNGQSISKKSVLELARKVADWQLENPKDTFMGDWVQGPFVNGLIAIGKFPGGGKVYSGSRGYWETSKLGRN